MNSRRTGGAAFAHVFIDPWEEAIMATYPISTRFRVLGGVSLLLGLLGGLFYWWTPLGMVLSLAGLVIGLSGAIVARRGTTGFDLLIGAIVVSTLALILNLVIAGLGLEIITFTA